MAARLRSICRAVLWIIRLRRESWITAFRRIGLAQIPASLELRQRALILLTLLESRLPVLGFRAHLFGVEAELEDSSDSEGVWDF